MLWRQLAPQLFQFDFSLREFNRLRKCLTMQEYKTQVLGRQTPSIGIFPLDQLLQDWSKLGEINKTQIFHKRFRRSVKTLKRHYELLLPAILDETQPPTRSPLERLYGQIKQFIRKWSGSMKIWRSFQWAAPLAATSQSLKETGLFFQILESQTGYDWIEQSQQLAKIERRYREETRFANELASKTPTGLVNVVRYLVIRDITG